MHLNHEICATLTAFVELLSEVERVARIIAPRNRKTILSPRGEANIFFKFGSII